MKLPIHSQTSTAALLKIIWMSYFNPHFTMDVITYPCWYRSQSMLVKGAPGGEHQHIYGFIKVLLNYTSLSKVMAQCKRDATPVHKQWSFVNFVLTHWGRVTHICFNNLTIIGSDNGLSPGRRQAILWTSAGILLMGPLATNFSEMLIEIHTFSFKKMHLKMSA